MKFQCIKCKCEWGQGNPDLEGYSHGLCRDCLKEGVIPIYRRRQLQEGNWDCFGKAADYCDQCECKYRQLCINRKGT